MKKSFNSDTAKKLADSNGIPLSEIYAHRDDGKVTTDNVKCAILKRHNTGVMVKLKVKVNGINPTGSNMNLLKKWFSEHSPSARAVVAVSDLRVFVVPGAGKTSGLEIHYRLHNFSEDEVEFANGFIVDPDDDGNYPIYTKDGRITSINRRVANGGEARLVRGDIIKQTVTRLRGSNSFGKNFGLGMMGNPTPFKTR